jgi:hypothetical protein
MSKFMQFRTFLRSTCRMCASIAHAQRVPVLPMDEYPRAVEAVLTKCARVPGSCLFRLSRRSAGLCWRRSRTATRVACAKVMQQGTRITRTSLASTALSMTHRPGEIADTCMQLACSAILARAPRPMPLAPCPLVPIEPRNIHQSIFSHIFFVYAFHGQLSKAICLLCKYKYVYI